MPKEPTARERLEQLAGSLEKHKFIWPAKCIRRYLDGECGSLDEAFGLKKKGKPGRSLSAENDALAGKVHALRSRTPPVTWEEIADQLHIDDPRALQRSYTKRRVPLLVQGVELRHRTALARLARIKKRHGRK